MDYIKNILTSSHEASKISRLAITRSIWTGRVIDIDDATDTMRVKVKIPGLDDIISSDDEKLWCNFFGYKGNITLPLVGEAVYVLIPDVSMPYTLRLWTGPIISDYTNITNDTFHNALTNTNEGSIAPSTKLSNLPESDGLFPTSTENKNDVNLLGRNNSDISLPKNNFKLRAGKAKTGTIKTNKKNPAILKGTMKDDDSLSSITMLADVLVLLSRDTNSSKLTKNNYDISTDDVDNIIKDGYSMLRAEPVIDLLQKIIQFLVVEHVHSYNGKEPINNIESARNLLQYDFNKLVNKGVKLN
jgi:hypothetical protein